MPDNDDSIEETFDDFDRDDDGREDDGREENEGLQRDDHDTVEASSIDGDEIEETVIATPSIMNSPRIDVTVNPRELSPADAESWHRATLDVSQQQAIEDLQATSNLGKTFEQGPSAKTTPNATTPSVRAGRSQRKTKIDTSRTADPNARESNQDEKTQQTPLIERTVSDRSLDQLRVCEVSDKRIPAKAATKRKSVTRDTGESSSSDQEGTADDRGDYRLVKKLGQGGMGDVFRAEQVSLGRLLAIKVLRPLDPARRKRLIETGRLEESETERQLQFLTEARVTGDLDHPNIVPIHDVALTGEGKLFYSMKQVVGTPWSKKLFKYSLDQNLDVLLRVCDAIAFAHTRGVIHRDIKPENIMLGDFGVVLVMDWGLALPTQHYSNELNKSVLATTGLGGTPAFMAPEMAKGPLDQIGPAADVYLLGATLFLIVTGKPPHHAPTVTECLNRVKANVIRETAPEYHGELLDIALKAMQTNPRDRYESVLDLQNAIRTYQQHAGSIDQSREAFAILNNAEEDESYENYSKATFKFEDAIESWDGNDDARRGLHQAKLRHAEAAFAKGDLDLSKSLLDQDDEDFQTLRQRVDQELDERQSRIKRLRLLRFATAAMLLFIMVGSLIALIIINQKRSDALAAQAKASQAAVDERLARQAAEDSKRFAETKQLEAEQQRSLAEVARDDATRANQKAQTARARAEDASRKESYESYLSRINLAKARLDDNDVAGAKQILQPLRDHELADGWEFRWLWRQVTGDQELIDVENEIVDVNFSDDGSLALVLTNAGEIRKYERSDGRVDETEMDVSSSGIRGQPTAIASSSRQDFVVVGTSEGEMVLVSGAETRKVEAHQARINDLAVRGDSIFTASDDHSIKRWDRESGKASDAVWHLSPVKRVEVQNRTSDPSEDFVIASVTQDENAGRITLWKATARHSTPLEKLGSFNGHQRAVSAVAIRDDGELMASADVEGNLFVWRTKQLRPTDYEKEIDGAFTGATQTGAPAPTYARLSDPRLAQRRTLITALGELGPRNAAVPGRAHSDAIETVDFSADGRFLVTGGNDFTMKTWDLKNVGSVDVFRGHEDQVRQAKFASLPIAETKHSANNRKSSDRVMVSASSDGQLRLWHSQANIRDAVGQSINSAEDPNGDSGLSKNAHDQRITSAVFSSDGSRVLTSSTDHTAKIFTIDPQTHKLRDPVSIRDKTLQEGTRYVAMSMRVDRSGKLLLVGNADGNVRIWDRQRGIELARVAGTGINQTIAISDRGDWLLTGSSKENEQAILWKLERNDEQGIAVRVVRRRSFGRSFGGSSGESFGGHDQVVTVMAVSDDGSRIFTGDSIGYGILWDAQSGERMGKPIETVRGFRINAAQFSANGNQLWLAADDDQLTQLDLRSRNVIKRFSHDGVVKDFTLSRDESLAITLSEQRTKRQIRTQAIVWQTASGKKRSLQRSRKIHENSGDGQIITAVGLGVTDTQQPNKISAMVVQQVFDSDSKLTRNVLQVWRNRGRALGEWDAWSETPQRRFQLPGSLGRADALASAEDGQCSTMNDNAVYRWDLETGKLIKSYRSHSVVTHADFSEDDRYVFTASRGVKVWDSQTGEAIAKLEQPHSGPVWCVASVSATDDSVRFATGGDDGLVKLWDYSRAGNKIALVRKWSLSTNSPVRFVEVDSTRTRLLFGGDHSAAKVVALQSGDRDAMSLSLRRTIDSFESTSVRMTCGSFSQDSNVVAIGTDDKRVLLYELDSQQEGSRTPIASFTGHADTVNDVRLFGSIDGGLRGFSVSADDSIRIWDPAIKITDGRLTSAQPDLRQWIKLKKHGSDVTAIDFTPDGNLMMTAGKDGTIFFWPAANEGDGSSVR